LLLLLLFFAFGGYVLFTLIVLFFHSNDIYSFIWNTKATIGRILMFNLTVGYSYVPIFVVVICVSSMEKNLNCFFYWIVLQMSILSHPLLCIHAREFAILQAMRYVVIFIMAFPGKRKCFSFLEVVYKISICSHIFIFQKLWN